MGGGTMRRNSTLFRSPGRSCCVHRCRTLRTKTSRFYHFPRRTPDSLRRWIDAVKVSTKLTKDMGVCHEHFTSEDFEQRGPRLNLITGAVPSQNLPLHWRNKFYPRDYGRMVKLLEYRGIGRLRLCHEAKLGRRLRRAQIEQKRNASVKTVSSLDERVSSDERPGNMSIPSTEEPVQVSASFSINLDDIDVHRMQHDDDLTSELIIKDEPLSEDEGKEETVEEMLAKMNEDSNDPEVSIVNHDADMDDELGLVKLYDNEDKHSCGICGKKYKSQRQLTAHCLSHPEFRRKEDLSCRLCAISFVSKDDLIEHDRIHHVADKPHVCMLCDEAFQTKASLIHHVNTHTIINGYRCKLCQQYFDTVEDLDQHIYLHKIIKKQYSCRECGQKFRSKAACWDHLNKHIRARSKPGLPCSECGRILSTKATLKEHMFIHSGEKPFECQLCGREIRHRANFIIHVQGHSLGQPFVCPTCGLGFPRKNELNSHVAAEHPDEGPYNCTICGMRFRTETRFLKHAVTHDACLEE